MIIEKLKVLFRGADNIDIKTSEDNEYMYDVIIRENNVGKLKEIRVEPKASFRFIIEEGATLNGHNSSKLGNYTNQSDLTLLIELHEDGDFSIALLG